MRVYFEPFGFFKAVEDEQMKKRMLLTILIFASLFVSATGVEISADDLMHIGQRISNIEKAFNTLHAGFTRDDDLPPIRFMTEPVKSGPYAGEVADKDKWNQVLDRYYQLHGWNPTTGRQTEVGLIALDLSDVARKLREYGKL